MQSIPIGYTWRGYTCWPQWLHLCLDFLSSFRGHMAPSRYLQSLSHKFLSNISPAVHLKRTSFSECQELLIHCEVICEEHTFAHISWWAWPTSLILRPMWFYCFSVIKPQTLREMWNVLLIDKGGPVVTSHISDVNKWLSLCAPDKKSCPISVFFASGGSIRHARHVCHL